MGNDTIAPVEMLMRGQLPSVQAALRRCSCVSSLRKEIMDLLRHPSSKLPCPAEDLVSLGASAIEMEELEDVIRVQWGNREDRLSAQQKLLRCGIDSPQALLRSLSSRGAGRCALNDFLEDAGYRMLKAQTMAELVADLEVRVRQRIELIEEGSQPVLVTAPHNIFLRRDGQPAHVMEEYTTLIAQRIARQLHGTCLSWSRSEQYRSELSWSLARHRGHDDTDGDPGEFLDPRNRDPNYLSADELAQNLWFQQMSRLAEKWRETLGRGCRTLHVDVHGCKDPPCTPSHLTVGLAAMRHEADSGRGLLSPARVEAFSVALESELSAALRGLDLRPRSTLVRVLAPDLMAAEDEIERLSGAWPPSVKRLTQSQQAVTFARFTHSCQLEMSKALRRILFRDEGAVIRFGKALRKAWASAFSLTLPTVLQASPSKQGIEPSGSPLLRQSSLRSIRSTRSHSRSSPMVSRRHQKSHQKPNLCNAGRDLP